jgi:hypothetical protein
MTQRLFTVAMVAALMSVGPGCGGDDSGVSAGGDPQERTSTSADLDHSESTAAADIDDDRRAPEFPPRPGSDCAGLRSESEWTDGAPQAGLAAHAGGTADYAETVTNDGTQTCSIVFNPCPPPGVLYTADGTRVSVNDTPCDAMGYPPEDLAPGESRTETWTADLTASPGDYILYVPQRDGAVAALPVSLEAAIEACPTGTIELRPDPAYEQWAPTGGETHPQLQFGGSEIGCTLRLARMVLELRPADEPDAPATQFIDENRRWFTLTRAGVLVEPAFGTIDLPPAQYEGTITVELDDGETFTHPGLLLIGR